MFPLALHNWFEIGAFLIALICFPALRNSVLKWFMPFLLFILTVETIGRYYRKVLHQSNAWLYNLSIPVEILFFSIIIMSSLQRRRSKIIVKLFLILYPLLVFINLLFNGLHFFNNYNVIIGSAFMIFFCCLCLYELFVNDEKSNISSEPIFWICTGVLLFRGGSFFYNLLFYILNLQGIDQGRKLFQTINNNLILVLYLSISVGLIWGATKKTY